MVQTKSKQSLKSHRISTQLFSSGSSIISTKSNAELESNTNYYLKLIIIASCLAMLTYQIIQLCNDYYKYPTLIQVVIEKPSSERITFPGVTVCGIRNDLKQNGEKNTIRPTLHQVLSDDIRKVVSCEIKRSQ
jgi:Amiloride-sensitive sodium channel